MYNLRKLLFLNERYDPARLLFFNNCSCEALLVHILQHPNTLLVRTFATPHKAY